MTLQWWQHPDAVRQAHQELIQRCCSILIEAVNRDTGERKLAAYSGCLLRFRDSGYLITAGHAMSNLVDVSNSSRWHIASTRLLDTPSAFETPANSLVLDLDSTNACFVNYKHRASSICSGLDIGMMALSELTLRALAKNRLVKFFSLDKCDVNAAFEGHYLLGIPGEAVHLSRQSQPRLVSVKHTILPVRRLKRSPSDLCKHRGCFYGTLTTTDVDGEPLRTIEGMSGGPIVGVRAEGTQVHFDLVAIQSSWQRKTRHVRASSTKQIQQYLQLAATDRDSWTTLHNAKEWSCTLCI